MKRYRIELLQTAEGVNLKKDKTRDLVIIFLWAENLKKVREFANKIIAASAVPTHIGTLEYVVKSIIPCEGLRLTKKEREMLKKSREDIRKGRVSRLI